MADRHTGRSPIAWCYGAVTAAVVALGIMLGAGAIATPVLYSKTQVRAVTGQVVPRLGAAIRPADRSAEAALAHAEARLSSRARPDTGKVLSGLGALALTAIVAGAASARNARATVAHWSAAVDADTRARAVPSLFRDL